MHFSLKGGGGGGGVGGWVFPMRFSLFPLFISMLISCIVFGYLTWSLLSGPILHYPIIVFTMSVGDIIHAYDIFPYFLMFISHY
jgi:hypothetical protein